MYDIVYGMHPIYEIIQAKKRKIYEIYLTKSKQSECAALLKKVPSYVKITYTDKVRLDTMAKTTDHQSIVAFVAPFLYKQHFFEPAKFPVILVCDSIQDTRNMGALLRSAYCTNIMGIVIPDKATTTITGSVLKSSAGLAEYLDIFRAKNTKYALDKARDVGYTIYLAAASGIAISEISFASPCCIVIGNEHSGIEKNFYQYGKEISIKQKNNLISYNASVAGGILLYHIATQLSLI